ncbi:MAG: tRNA (adenosine(37)-N6)-threonylcarbamoyltransferase complex ATPase subunit type 1 TsaE [Rhizobiaceae bacterium]|nr:tRNA (adenosine(37)-N6)-threonylcarbamoyltransferase complex ATPase subunit type 1 TsaE [Rhizobiaceae bacterium]
MTERRFRRFLADEAATALLGNDIAMALRAGDVVALSGDLGVGKTTLARAIVRTQAGNTSLDVPSPTFTIVQSYDSRIPVAHFDLYRLSSADELEELGFDEAIASGAVLVEWPDRAGDRIPASAIRVELADKNGGRSAEIAARGAAVERLQRSLDIRAFLDTSGMGGAWREHLTGDASTRAYEMLHMPDQPALVLMNAPRQPDGPPIRDGKPYSQIARLAESVVPFVGVGRALKEAGFAAPAIHASDLDQGLLAIEHLGGEGVLSADGAPVPERYLAAAELLAELHARSWPRVLPVSDGIDHRLPDYDREAMLIEISLMLDWYLPLEGGRELNEAERDRLFGAWNTVLDRLDGAEKSIVLRDFHSPNLIWRADRIGADRLGLIDFQDALWGPSAYDVASLAMDARVTIRRELEQEIVAAYVAARQKGGAFDRAGFEEAYAIMAAQRSAKILGIFVRLDRRDGKPAYLKHLPRMRDYFARALAHEALAPVGDALEAVGLGASLRP